MRPAAPFLCALLCACTTQDMAEVRDVAPGTLMGPSTTGAGTTWSSGDLPCDLDALLASMCRGCHSSPPKGGAPMPLVTRTDLTAPAGPGKIVAQRALERMRDAKSPMPPASNVTTTAAQQQLLADWIAAGTPAGSCGTIDGGIADLAPPPTVCSSNRFWTKGDDKSPQMHPGRACIGCHDAMRESGGSDDAPDLVVGGTAYATVREPDECLGGPLDGGDSWVEVTDARGVTYVLRLNGSGNFLLDRKNAAGFTFPYTAKVTNGASTRAMQGARTTGDCNSCHSLQGANGAPGRILLP